MRRRSRRWADNLAKAALERKTPISDGSVLEALSAWRFKHNKNRPNMTPEGQDRVSSDTLGLVRARRGPVLLTKPTTQFSHFAQLLARWLRDAGPSDVDFHWTYSLAFHLTSKVK